MGGYYSAGWTITVLDFTSINIYCSKQWKEHYENTSELIGGNNETDLYLYYTDMDWGDLLGMEWKDRNGNLQPTELKDTLKSVKMKRWTEGMAIPIFLRINMYKRLSLYVLWSESTERLTHC